MKDLPKLAISIVGCELVGIIGSVFTASAIPTWYANLNKPFFSPPNWLFGPVWTILYLLMGVAFFLIWKRGWKSKKNRQARNLFLIQLGLNFIWTPIFFGIKSPLIALVIIMLLLFFIILTIKKFLPISKTAGILLIPYLIWVTFATLLNAAILVLNP